MAKRGKKYQQVAALVNSEGEYTLEEACDLVKKTTTTTFDASIDIDIRLGVDPRHADQMVRGTVSLPHGTGKDIRVLGLVIESLHVEARVAGADDVGFDRPWGLNFVRSIANPGNTRILTATGRGYAVSYTHLTLPTTPYV